MNGCSIVRKSAKNKAITQIKRKIDTERRVNSAIDLIGDVPFKDLTLKHGLSVLEPYRQSGATAELKKRYLVLKSIADMPNVLNIGKTTNGNILAMICLQ